MDTSPKAVKSKKGKTYPEKQIMLNRLKRLNSQNGYKRKKIYQSFTAKTFNEVVYDPANPENSVELRSRDLETPILPTKQGYYSHNL